MLFLFLGLFLYSGCNMVIWMINNAKIKSELKDINNKVIIKEVDENKNTKIINNNEEEDKNNPYWNYIKMNLINVDFTELKKINNETVGWIQVAGTNINYPVVQAENNTFYLTHTFDKSYNVGGWVFMDYRNSNKDFDKNTIIYAHNRKNSTMFGTLKNILKSDWLNNTNNYVIKMSDEYKDSLWQVFSVYHIPTTSDYLDVNFSTNEEYLNFLKMLLNRSMHNFNTDINENDKIITLSTCYGSSEKMVIHAKLIKVVNK